MLYVKLTPAEFVLFPTLPPIACNASFITYERL